MLLKSIRISMHIGSMQVRLRVREARSLKDKRQVLRSIIDRLRNSFNVSVAEVAARDNHQLVVLGIAAVGEDAVSVKSILEKIADALRKHPVAEFCDCELAVDHA